MTSHSLTHTPALAILLPVLNGARMLPDQLASLLGQTVHDWHLFIGDDGSIDQSRRLLADFVQAHPGKAQVYDGPQQGISANILSLLSRVDPATQMVAFCDQDDVWDVDKMARAIAALGQTEAPALYCSRSRLIDSDGRFLRLSPRQPRGPSFRNALVQNIASGNTMVLNRAGWMLLLRCSEMAKTVPHHDWWTYQLITGAGGTVVHDNAPRLDYRQHPDNVLGAATGLRGTIRRVLRTVTSNLSRDLKRHLQSLHACHHVLTPLNAQVLAQFMASRRAGPGGRLRGVISAGLYRQTRLGTLGLWAAALVGRL